MLKITSTLGTETMVRVNKTVARRLYNAGNIIYLLPCKVLLNNAWQQPKEISKNISKHSFEAVINMFEYYNCQYNQLGYYATYYVNEEVL